MAIAKCENCGDEKQYVRDSLTGVPQDEWGTVRLKCGCEEHLPHHNLTLDKGE